MAPFALTPLAHALALGGLVHAWQRHPVFMSVNAYYWSGGPLLTMAAPGHFVRNALART